MVRTSGAARPWLGWALSLVALAAAAVLVILVVLRVTTPDVAAPDEPTTVEPVTATSPHLPLTGEAVEEVPERPALLVKVSNSPEARPQTGLGIADVVFEELTESGVTRFMAVFHSELPEVVGPVRSARPVDTQLLAGFGYPLFAYSGARAEVRAMVAASPATAITETDVAFFRDDGTYASHPFAPHDLFLRPALLLDAASALPALPELGWAFAEPVPDLASVPSTDLVVRMSDYFSTHWRYDAAAGVYRRSQEPAGAAWNGVGAANVAVLDVDHYVGASGYPETDVVGEGAALVMRDGRRFEARWSKPTVTSPLLVLDPDGAPFPLKPGPTWILLPDQLPAA